jgi:AcrR family transcriptional regulator
VQSVFGTREALIDAMLERWLTREQVRFDEELHGARSSRARTIAHIRTTGAEPREESRRVAPLMAALVGTTDKGSSSSRWYRSRIGDLSANSEEDRRLRIAFLAAEGAYYLRNLAGFEMSEKLWNDIFSDLQECVQGSQNP